MLNSSFPSGSRLDAPAARRTVRPHARVPNKESDISWRDNAARKLAPAPRLHTRLSEAEQQNESELQHCNIPRQVAWRLRYTA